MAMAHDDPETTDHAGLDPPAHARQNLVLAHVDPGAERAERIPCRREARLQGRHQRAVGLPERRAQRRRAPAGDVRRRGAGAQVETQIDPVLLDQRKAQQPAALRRTLDGVRRPIQRMSVGCVHHEPQIRIALTLVVVIDLAPRAHQRGDLRQPRLRHAQRRQRADADTVGREHRAHAADRPGIEQSGECVEHLHFAHAQLRREHGERCRDQRECALELVRQAKLQSRLTPRVRHRCEACSAVHKPIRNARAVKKMPLGFSAASVARCSRLDVS